MTQLKGQGSWWDLAAFTERIMQMLEPRIQDMVETIVQGSLDRQSIAWANLQVLKHREYREHRERRAHRDQPRFVGNQDVPDPYMPPGGAQPDLLLKVNALVGGVDSVAKQLCDLREQLETLSDRMDQQFAYANATDAWLKDDEAEAQEEEVEAPDD